VPSALGYGAEQRSKVKPYTPLIFEVELLEVTD
jgi:FKBP-type peptidyl-prolyl cis-trans isomerase